MLITLIILFIRKIIRRIKRRNELVLKKTALAVFLLLGFMIQGQTKKTFAVVRNDNEIGTIEITRTILGDETHYDLQAVIQTRVIFKYDIKGDEKTIFRDGKLLYSSIKRVCNNRNRVDQELKWSNGSYQIRKKKKLRKLNADPIVDNLITLFFNEPKSLSKIYCDKHSSMCKIIPLNGSAYKVVLPDGNYSIYYYRNTLLHRVKVVNLLYKVELVST